MKSSASSVSVKSSASSVRSQSHFPFAMLLPLPGSLFRRFLHLSPTPRNPAFLARYQRARFPFVLSLHSKIFLVSHFSRSLSISTAWSTMTNWSGASSSAQPTKIQQPGQQQNKEKLSSNQQQRVLVHPMFQHVARRV